MDYSDSGYKSRKMVMAYVVIFLMSLGFLAAGKWTSLSVVYGEFIMGLLAATSIFTGANAAIKWMAHKAHIKDKDKEIATELEVSDEPPVEPLPPKK